MKMIMAIIQDKDANRLSNILIDNNVRATKLSSTGGFLKSGNATFIIGVEDHRVEEVIELIKVASKARTEYITSPLTMDMSVDAQFAYPIEVEVGGATIFVLPVEGFYHF
ncbi:MAG: cyclic-di-AMP receptor [Streptococcaceae bacterium]|jgi:uncharacterized protein YaaQ|nr:cyclic-di-AMP receptor [Streptococcaceae bacterium]